MVTTEVLAPNTMPMSIQFMARYGEALLDAGYRILPIQPGTKKPGMMRQGMWHDYPQWSRHGMRDTTAYELDVWATWPDAAIGVATGTSAAHPPLSEIYTFQDLSVSFNARHAAICRY